MVHHDSAVLYPAWGAESRTLVMLLPLAYRGRRMVPCTRAPTTAMSWIGILQRALSGASTAVSNLKAYRSRTPGIALPFDFRLATRQDMSLTVLHGLVSRSALLLARETSLNQVVGIASN